MVTERNSRYAPTPKPARMGEPDDLAAARMFNVSGEGDVPKDSPVTVGETVGQDLVSYFVCRCQKRARFTPNELGRRFAPTTRLWDIAPRLKCKDCGRKGDILFLTRVRSAKDD